MHSKYLSSLNQTAKEDLKNKLCESQHSKCFICELPIDLELHKQYLHIDHIQPLSEKGKDTIENFALTHDSCNVSKQASNLKVARLLAKFDSIKKSANEQNRDSATLSDILKHYNGSKYHMSISISDKIVKYSFPELENNEIYQSMMFIDPLSNQKSFFAEIPIEYMFHDSQINPRGIGSNLRKLIEEFDKGRPQLHAALARIDTNTNSKILIFDGQHKAAAQILLGTKKMPIRIFVDPDIDLLLTTNTNAGDGLRQVAFSQSIKRRLGHTIYSDRISKYQKEHKLSEDDMNFSEEDLVKYFKGEKRELKKHIRDAIRDGITRHPENTLIKYIDLEGGRAKEKPLSYSTIDKTFYAFFIYDGILSTPLNYKVEHDKNPRELEKNQLVRLMTLISNCIYDEKFDLDIGTSKIESKIQKGEDISEPHLIAYRISKEEIIYNWLKYIKSIIQQHFALTGVVIDNKKLFQETFPEQLWINIRNFLQNLQGLPIWINKEHSKTVFGGKQNNNYWEHIFKTGNTLSEVVVMTSGLDIIEMIKPST